jgi:hypothetical protein
VTRGRATAWTCLALGGGGWSFGLFRLLVDPGPDRLAEQLRFLRDWLQLFSEVLEGLGAGLWGAAACGLGTVLVVKGLRLLSLHAVPAAGARQRHGIERSWQRVG